VFASRVVTGALRVSDASLAGHGRRLRFDIEPVLFLARSISVPGPRGGFISGLTIQATASGVAVGLSLDRVTRVPEISVRSDQVTVTVPADKARR
jgi:hypothetical protein